MKKILTLCLILLSLFNVKAQSVLSAYISYTQQSGNILVVNYNMVVAPNDSNYNVNNIHTTIACEQTNDSVILTGLKMVSSRKLIYNCYDTAHPWEIKFQKIIDLGNSTYSNILSCCKVRLDAKFYRRNSDINTVQPAIYPNLYVYSTYGNCGNFKNKTSAAITSFDFGMPCLNKPYYFNYGLSDTSDFDSLSYELMPAMLNRNEPVGYLSTLDYDIPLNCYFPGSLKHPYSNPTSNPPIGMFFDKSTGDLIYTPTKSNQQSAIVQLVKEWRKDSLGVYQAVGSMLLERGVLVQTCPDNNPPTIMGSDFYAVCEGDRLCFDITSDDIVFIPPPPQQAPLPDTVGMSWNRGIPGATFSILDPKALHQTGRFCWTPEIGKSTSYPYSFTVTARDDNCPLNATTVKTFRVRVDPKPRGTIVKARTNNGYAVSYQDNINFPAYVTNRKFEILDDNGIAVTDKSMANFVKSDSNVALINDELEISMNGTYILKSTINNLPKVCTTVYLDTINHFNVNVDETNRELIRVYPNPTNRNVSFSKSINKVKLYNAIGQNLQTFSKAKAIDLKQLGLQSGIYFLHLELNDQYQVVKVVLE